MYRCMYPFFFFRVKVWSKVLNAQCLKVKSNGLLSPHTKRSKRFETILKSAYKTCTWCLIYFICNHKLRVIMKKMRLFGYYLPLWSTTFSSGLRPYRTPVYKLAAGSEKSIKKYNKNSQFFFFHEKVLSRVLRPPKKDLKRTSITILDSSYFQVRM